jgi:aminoglycoside phosphotransferase (APT) family kinase protein
MAGNGDKAPLVDEAALASWMDGRDLAAGEPLAVRRITTGHSNELFLVERGELRLALRRPPRNPLSPTAHDMAREFRVINAAVGSIPVPEPVALGEDTGVIGAPFYLMELIDGAVVRHGIPDSLDGPEAGRDLAFELIDVLTAIHALDWRAGGLEDFGRPEGYLERQGARWLGQLDRYRARPLPEVDEVGAWLQGNLPTAQDPALIHGDYTLVNVMYAPEPPIRLVAVVDWELATIGDPLVDLGWLLGLWHERGEIPLEGADAGVIGLPLTPGMPTRAELADRYAAASGRDVRDLGYYCALGLFKLACVMEGSYARYVSGKSEDPYFAALEESVPALARRALSFVE